MRATSIGRPAKKVFGLVGWSGSGKTTLLVRLLPTFIRRGLTVSTVKHGHHGFDIDKPGKDSYLHREAGASEVLIASSKRWALLHELRGASEPVLDDLIRHMTPVDLILVEGYKLAKHGKLEVYRTSIGKDPIFKGDSNIVAVASDMPISGAVLPCFDLGDIDGIANFIMEYCRL